MTRRRCGCRSVRKTEYRMCAIHFAALHLNSFYHGEPHRDCCDMSLAKQTLRDCGVRTAYAAARETQHAEYWLDLLKEGRRKDA